MDSLPVFCKPSQTRRPGGIREDISLRSFSPLDLPAIPENTPRALTRRARQSLLATLPSASAMENSPD
jgi:hypothetical protein